MSVESGLKLLLSAERGITSDGMRKLGPKTKEMFKAMGTREVLTAMIEAFKNAREENPELLSKANSMITSEMILSMRDFYNGSDSGMI